MPVVQGPFPSADCFAEWTGPVWKKTWMGAANNWKNQSWELHKIEICFDEKTVTEVWRKARPQMNDSIGGDQVLAAEAEGPKDSKKRKDPKDNFDKKDPKDNHKKKDYNAARKKPSQRSQGKTKDLDRVRHFDWEWG
ncbi:unnamed protein product [Cladocopium goreaui]|uniref:Uncharacterized protein n=1 Tax=Cladocopium goreaui TaxID=2562237 RepID=A0A9P1GSZ7_9DINO|nr:unnamed protein product [Cladocopium goreaui]